MAQQLGIRESIRFRGPLAGADKWTAILSCDALVLPSRHDAFPTVVVEAMASARIVVVTNETGVSPFVERERCGYSIPATARGSLAVCSEWWSPQPNGVGWPGAEGLVFAST